MGLGKKFALAQEYPLATLANGSREGAFGCQAVVPAAKLVVTGWDRLSERYNGPRWGRTLGPMTGWGTHEVTLVNGEWEERCFSRALTDAGGSACTEHQHV